MVNSKAAQMNQVVFLHECLPSADIPAYGISLRGGRLQMER
jgi:hypothetical protein